MNGKTKAKTKTKMTMNTIAEEYFYNINPLAQRIGEDVAATKEAYEGLWNTLSLSERNQAIDETIIQPEVALKYTINNENNKNNESRNYSGFNDKKDTKSDSCYPKLRIQTGMKYVIDDTGTTLRWRDEHSAPFSVMTQSQMNLNLFDCQENDKKSITVGNFIGESAQRYSNTIISKNNFKRDDINTKNKDTKINDEHDLSNFNDNTNRDDNEDDNYKNYSLVNKLTNKNDDIKDDDDYDDYDDDDDGIYKKFIEKKKALIKIKNNIDKEKEKEREKEKEKEDDEEDEYDDDKKFLVNDMKSEIIVKTKMKINLQNIDKDKVVKLLNDGKSNSSNSNNADESTALLLDTPSSYNRYKASQLQNDDGIPKTGFEFLDNW